jgi:hypothetical protein
MNIARATINGIRIGGSHAQSSRRNLVRMAASHPERPFMA